MGANGDERIRGFPPLARPGARVLILGSMPSAASLAKHRYYAHPRNAFWPIIVNVLGITASGYEERARQVTSRGIAIWDVLSDCVRPGSLDSSIDERTAVTNDFSDFFNRHPSIRHVFFNGAKSESIYLRRVLPQLEAGPAALPGTRLPSTSPANAGMSFEEKAKLWGSALRKALE